MSRVVIGTRGSKLALWQSNWIKKRLEQSHLGLEVEIRIITTTGDRITDVSLPKLGEQGKGLFTKELEIEMLGGRIDIAVHSLKDLPTELPPGLQLGAVTEREDVRDALVAREASSFHDLKPGAIIGTGSLRRQAQLLAVRKDLILKPVRGNVDTRLRKVETGEYDALILASAGLRRLDRSDRITEYLPPQLVLPAVGQGAIAVESREGDNRVNGIIGTIEHGPTRLACEAERALLRGLGGGCLAPIAALGLVSGDQLSLEALVARPDGSEVIRAHNSGPASEAQQIGFALANKLLERGAREILGL